MEGLAYWLFIAALYFLSSLMKKKQQKVARKRLDQEDVEYENDDFTPKEPKAIDDFFDQLKNYGKEFLVQDEPDIAETKNEIEELEESVYAKIDIEPKETSRAIFDDLSEKNIDPIHKEYRIHNKQNQNISFLVSSLLEDNNKVKKAIILKEIFDKPRGLRRLIR